METVYFTLSSIYRFYKSYEAGIDIEKQYIPADLIDNERYMYEVVKNKNVAVSLSDADRVILLEPNIDKLINVYNYLISKHFYSVQIFLKLLIDSYNFLKNGGQVNGTILQSSLHD